MIRRIMPNTVFPIHTESPELFDGTAKKVVIVEEAKGYIV